MKRLIKPFSFSILLLFILVYTESNPFDSVFLLFIESLAVLAVGFFMMFFVKKFSGIIIGLLIYFITVPIVIYFLYCGAMFVYFMFEVGFAIDEVESPFILSHYVFQVIDGEYKEGIINILNYYGTDLYWIVGSLLLMHLIFSILKRDKNEKDAFFSTYFFEAIGQSAILCLFSLVIAIPIIIITLIYSDKTWPFYLTLILFRFGLDWWREKTKKES